MAAQPSLALAAAESRVKRLEADLKASRAAHDKTLQSLEQARQTSLSKSPNKRALSPKKGDIVEIIAADVHGNKQDPDAVAAFLADVQIIKPDRIVLLGDILDAGGFLSSHHTMGYMAETDDSYEDDIAAANQFLDRLEKASGGAETHYVAGNHEHRIERWAVNQKARNQKDLQMLLRMFAAENVLELKRRGIHYYGYGDVQEGYSLPGWMNLDNMHFTHKVSLAKNAADAAMSNTAGNICFGDTHRQDYKPTVLQDGTLRAVWNTGCLCKRQPYYANTRNTGWTHGYNVRVIDRKRGKFQMIQILIEDGVSLAGHIFKR